MRNRTIFVAVICLFMNILCLHAAHALDLHNFDTGTEGWYINQRGQVFPYGDPQLSWTESTDYKDNPSSGALQLALDLQGSEGIFDATIIQSADWGLPGQKTWNLSSYEYIHAMVYVPEGGPPELEAVVYSKSGEGWVWSQSDWTRLIAGKWNKLSLPIERIAAPSEVHAFGVKVGGDLSYQGVIFIDGIHSTAHVESIGFDFDVRGFVDTAPGFTSVIVAPYDTGTGHGYESIENINGILRNPGDPLTRDCHYSWGDATFLVDLPDANYEVKIHFGDLYIPTDGISIYAEGELKVENISTASGEYRTESFEVTVNDGQLDLTFHDEGGVNNLWIINGIEVIPPDTTPPVTSAEPPGGTYYYPQGIILRADEPATIYYTTDGSEPTVDSPVYTEPINIFETTTINFFGIDASDKVESPYNTENYVIQSSTSNLLLDFECRGYEDTAPGFTSVPVAIYDSGSGYGYVSRDSTNNILRYTTDPLRRDSHYGWADNTFLVDVPDVDYQVHIFFGDLYIPTDNVSVYAEGELKLENISTAPGEYKTETFDVTVNDGQLNLTFRDGGGQNSLWIIDGMAIIGPDTTPPITSANPPGGTYNSPQTVNLSANEPATIYYTTDGSDPSTSSSIYTAPIQINPGTTLKFFGVDEAGNEETPHNTEDYIFTPPPPYTFSISENMDPVSRYEKLELQVIWDGSGSYSNPFDPDEVSFSGTFTSPDGTEWQIPGFWNGNAWLIRFSPRMEGTWNYSVKVMDYAGTNESGEFSFSCAASTLHGWLRVSEDDPHYLRYDDETSFFGIGDNRAWSLEQLGWNSDTGYQLLIDMETYGMNILGFWMAPWDTQLVTLASGYDYFDINRANELDAIIEGAEEHGIHLVLAIWAHDALRCGSHHWGSGHWDENPFSELGTCDEFFTDETMWEYQKKLYRYIIARWGYSQAIGVWHTICEIEGTGSSAYEWTDKNIWHEKITNYFKNNDPFSHPTSGSNTHYSGLWPEGYSVMDMPQIHVYEGVNDPIYLAQRIHYWTSQLRTNYQKPVFIGEFGTNNEGLQPDHIHNGIWAGLASGAAITPLDWNDGGAWGDMSTDMFDHMAILADFVVNIDLDSLSLNPAIISVGGCNVWAMSNNSYAFGWILDPNSPPTTSGKTLIISGLIDRSYDIIWHNTRSGDVQVTQANCISGTLQTTIPDFSKDVAFKIQATDDVTPPVTSADPSGGTYDSAQTVTLSADEPATIYYTLDGTDPTTSSPVYSTPLMIEADSTLKFFGMDIAGNTETPFHIEQYTFTVIDTTPPVTSADPSGGTYDSAQTVTLSTDEPANIYYTLDGTDPTTSSPVYSTPLIIEADSTLKFFGVDIAGNIEVPSHLEQYFFQVSLAKLDFDVRGFLDTAPGYSSFPVTAYSPTIGYGYESTMNINGILRNPGNPLTRDCHYSWNDGTLLVDLPDGHYQILVHLGELYIPTDNIAIYAEGELKLENISTASGEYKTETFDVTVNDGQLNLIFHDDGGQNSLWIINGLEIINLPNEQLLSLEQLGGVTAYGDYYWYDASNDSPNSNWGNPYSQDFINNFNYGNNNENTGDSYDYPDSIANLTFNYSNQGTFSGNLNVSGLKPNFAYQVKLFADGTDELTLEQIGYSGRWWKIAPDGTGSNATDSEYESFKNGTGFSGYTFNSYRLFDYLVTDQFGNASLGFDVDSSYHVLWKKVQRERGLNDSAYTSHEILNPPDSWIYGGTISEKTVQIYAENERGSPGSYPLPSGIYRYIKLIMTEESWHHEWKWASAMGSPYFQFEINE